MAARDRELSISLSPTRCRSATDTASERTIGEMDGWKEGGRTIGEMDGWKEGGRVLNHTSSLCYKDVFRIGAVSLFQRFTRYTMYASSNLQLL